VAIGDRERGVEVPGNLRKVRRGEGVVPLEVLQPAKAASLENRGCGA
jgi:hypothetical protein